MPGPKLCPNCGNILRAEGLPDPIPARHLRQEILFWLAMAAVLAFLLGASTTGERVGGLGVIALLIWLRRRSRRGFAPPPGGETGRYRCDFCGGQFEGEELRDISSRRAVD